MFQLFSRIWIENVGLVKIRYVGYILCYCMVMSNCNVLYLLKILGSLLEAVLFFAILYDMFFDNQVSEPAYAQLDMFIRYVSCSQFYLICFTFLYPGLLISDLNVGCFFIFGLLTGSSWISDCGVVLISS